MKFSTKKTIFITFFLNLVLTSNNQSDVIVMNYRIFSLLRNKCNNRKPGVNFDIEDKYSIDKVTDEEKNIFLQVYFKMKQ